MSFGAAQGTGASQATVDTVDAALEGAAGIVTWPSAAAPANGVSLAEGLRYLSEKQGYRIASKNITVGTGAPAVTENLFTVTGEVEATVYGFIESSVTSGGALTLELGVTGNTAGLIAITAVAQLLLNRYWVTTTTAVGIAALPSAKLISAANIVHVVRDAAATAGVITYYAVWRPVSSDGALVAA